MQLTAVLSASAVFSIASASASDSWSAPQLMKSYTPSKAGAIIVNRCPYPVHVWSVFKADGCDDSAAVILQTGDTYHENYNQDPDKTGISIKVSKTDYCTQGSIAQLEYRLNFDPKYYDNYLDVSYVDCQDNDCPTRQEGYYLNVNGGKDVSIANDGSERMAECPVLSCSNMAECSKMSYVLPDDPQTKSCNHDTNMVWYMCGGEAPGAEAPEDDDSTPATSSSQEIKEEQPAPTPVKAQVANAQAAPADAEVTPAPVEVPQPEKKIKTEIVVVTEYVHAKRHAHRHQHFHA